MRSKTVFIIFFFLFAFYTFPFLVKNRINIRCIRTSFHNITQYANGSVVSFSLVHALYIYNTYIPISISSSHIPVLSPLSPSTRTCPQTPFSVSFPSRITRRSLFFYVSPSPSDLSIPTACVCVFFLRHGLGLQIKGADDNFQSIAALNCPLGWIRFIPCIYSYIYIYIFGRGYG